MQIAHKKGTKCTVIGLLGLALALPIGAKTQTAPLCAGKENQSISAVHRANFHQTLAQYYRNEADRIESEAHTYVQLAKMYRHSFQQLTPAPLHVIAMFEGAAQAFDKMARTNRELAAMHEEVATWLSEGSQPEQQVPADPMPID